MKATVNKKMEKFIRSDENVKRLIALFKAFIPPRKKEAKT